MTSTSHTGPAPRVLAATVAVPLLALGLTGCASKEVEWDAEKIEKTLSAHIGAGADTEVRSTEEMTEDESFSEQMKRSFEALDLPEECLQSREAMAEQAEESMKGVAESSRESDDENSFLPAAAALLIVLEDEDAREEYSDLADASDEKCDDGSVETEPIEIEIDGEDARVNEIESPGFVDAEATLYRTVEVQSGNVLLQVSDSVPAKGTPSLEDYGEEKKGEIEDLLKQLRD